MPGNEVLEIASGLGADIRIPELGRYVPHLAMLDTGELLDHIPKEGPWTLPKPWDMRGLPESLIEASLPSFQERWDELLGDWVVYLNQVEVGFHIRERFRTEGKISGKERDYYAFLYFQRGGVAPNLENIQSVRKSLAALLSPEKQKELNIAEEGRVVSQSDIALTRTVVRNFELTIPPLRSLMRIHEDDD